MAVEERGVVELSQRARSLWGKSDGGEGEGWLPLYVHMLDSIGVAERLWDEWVPPGTRDILACGLGGDQALARTLFRLVSGLHDIGKATPAFQARPCGRFPGEGAVSLAWKPRKAGLPFRAVLSSLPAHPVAGEVIFESYLTNVWGWEKDRASSLAAIIGGHHGRPPGKGNLLDARTNRPGEMGTHEDYGSAWTDVQRELIDCAVCWCGSDVVEGLLAKPRFLGPQAAAIATGLVIIVDWIASNQLLFPLMRLVGGDDGADEYEDGGCENLGSEQLEVDGVLSREAFGRRGDRAWKGLGLLPYWHATDSGRVDADERFCARFSLPQGAKLRPMQRVAVEIAQNVADPGLLIIEAPMGEGKTEAAFAAAETMAQRSGRGGVCIALPTMATTDAMFGRVHEWLRHLPHAGDGRDRSVYLAHGKAGLNDEFQGIARASFAMSPGTVDVDGGEGAPRRERGTVAEPTEDVVVSEWLQGRKKGVLANFLVCTVDQVLMGALAMKHLALRQLALVNKVVVIDECHAYDDYMQRYLKRALEWLGGTRTPAILLSATLPENLRDGLVEAYRSGWRASCGEISRPAVKRLKPWQRQAPAARDPSDHVSEEPVLSSAPISHDAYPLLTYTDGQEIRSVAPAASGRTLEVRMHLMGDGDDELVALLCDTLTDGGCAGVICDTVMRAQRIADVLERELESVPIILTHARFIDVDRMENEERLRGCLGPKSNVHDGTRPQRLVVVGTQVLEQSLDIDFDVMVTDIAPIDLLMQRIGRLHRHLRGQNGSERPPRLRAANCYLRGIGGWEGGIPRFDRAVERVYYRASLLEALAVLGMEGPGAVCDLSLPNDIARLVRRAYSDDVAGSLPALWGETYATACKKRSEDRFHKQERAATCCIQSVYEMVRDEGTLVDWYEPRTMASPLAGHDEDRGQRAVRDTQETVEVLLFELRDGLIYLLPWVGDEKRGVLCGSEVPVGEIPPDDVARVAAQSAVRLPLSLCRPECIDELIDELEGSCGNYVGAWQESSWLAGRLALLLERRAEGVFETTVLGHCVRYTRERGLEVEKGEDE